MFLWYRTRYQVYERTKLLVVLQHAHHPSKTHTHARRKNIATFCSSTHSTAAVVIFKKYDTAVRSRISSKPILASCVILRSRGPRVLLFYLWNWVVVILFLGDVGGSFPLFGMQPTSLTVFHVHTKPSLYMASCRVYIHSGEDARQKYYCYGGP